MAWGVFYRPQGSTWAGSPAVPDSNRQQPGGFVKEYSYRSADVPSASVPNYVPQHPPQKPVVPHFRVPLSEAILNDPAFSEDPRSHPHFPHANARSYKTLPDKLPRSNVLPVPALNEPTAQQSIKHPTTPAPARTAERPCPPAPPVSLDHESHIPKFVASTTSTVSSTTPVGPSLVQTQGSRTTVPSVSHTSTSLDPPPYTNFPSMILALLPQERAPQPKATPTRAGTVPDFAGISTSKGRIKNLVRRLTKRYHLDRIDELDETDPFGIGFHHSGPYEAIASNLAEETSPPSHDDTDKSTGARNLKNKNTRAVRPSRAVMDPSPGNQTPVDADRTADEISTHQIQAWTVSVTPRETTARIFPSNYQSLPNQTVHPPELFPVMNQSSPSTPPRTPYINPPSAPYVPDKAQFTTYSHEPVQHNPSPSQSPELLPDANHVTPPPIHTPTRTPYSHDKPPRVQHLPKRLVMPAPLHNPQVPEWPSSRALPQPPYPSHGTVGGDPVLTSSRTNKTHKLRRKKSSSCPSRVPLPSQPSIYPPDVGQTMGKKLSNAAVEGQKIHQETRRRRLSKRKVGG
ncbi:hypothetical protein EDC04DRAFT_2619948 [Pisolithus marmoratus]|nr:hypothetical protein EDC04DRAFT_2619948 [Pisolithus marmoratus]